MRLKVAPFLVVAALMIGPSVGAAQENASTQLTPTEMRLTAINALEAGQAARALALAESLLVRDPDDAFALRVAGRAALEIGQSDVASERGRHLFDVAEDDQTRFYAARLVALAETQEDNFTTAQFWLRRARQIAPDAAAARQAASDFRAVRQRNPFQFSLSLGIAPSSNINNGSSEDTFDVYFFGQSITLPLPASAQSLSGTKASASVVLGYTLAESVRGRTQVYLSAQSLRYALSAEAKEQAPTFDSDTLDYGRIVAGLRQDWRVGASGQPITARLDYGITHLGGNPYAHDVALGISSFWPVADKSQITAGLRVGRISYDATGFESDTTTLDLGWNHRLKNGDALSIATTFERARSDDSVQLNSDRTRVEVTYNFGRTLEYFDISFAVGHQRREVGTAASHREEVRNDATLSVGLPKVEYYGFSPVTTVVAQNTESDVSRFTSEGLSLDLSIRSNF